MLTSRSDSRAGRRPRPARRWRPFLEALEDRSLPSAGSLDLNFGTNGKVMTNIGSPGVFDAGNCLALQADGKIIVAGVTQTGGTADFALVRYNTDGSLDTGFGTGGKVVTDLGGLDNPFEVLVRPDGRILVAGRSNDRIAVAGYLPGGNPDPAFGSAGKVTTPVGGGVAGEDVRAALQPDGRLVVAGTTAGGALFVARYLPGGAPDADFDADGVVVTPFGTSVVAGGLAVLPDGKVLAAAALRNFTGGLALARYLPDGSPDTGFGTGGKTVTALGPGGLQEVNDLVPRPDGTFLVAGAFFVGGTVDFGLACCLPNGQPDPGFGAGGLVLTDFAASEDVPGRLAVQANGAILLAGLTNAGGGGFNFALARYLPNGALDTSFSFDGKVITDFAGSSDLGRGVVVRPGGGVVAAGSATGSNNSDFALAQYEGDPVPLVTVDDAVALEGTAARPGSAAFPLRLSEPPAAPVTVSFGTADGSAHAGTDYQAAAGSVTFSAGQQTATVVIPLVGDAVDEGNETFTLLLTGAAGAALADGSATATVVDDDGPSSTLSGSVYDDANFNGARDAGEAGVGGVTVRLLRRLPTLNEAYTLVGTTTTSPGGAYSFTGLPAGLYRIEEVQPGFLFVDGDEQPGLLGGTVGDDRLTVQLPAGVTAPGYNFGEHKLTVGVPVAPLFPNRSITTPVGEGGTAVLSGVVFDGNPHDRFTLDIDWGDGTPVETHRYGPGRNGDTVRVPHRYADDGTYTVRLAWRDQDGLGNSGELQVVVNNVPPGLEPIRDVTVGPSGKLNLPVRFTDPGADLWSVRVDYGDGTLEELPIGRAGQPLLLRHQYTRPGTYRVTVAVTDDDGDIGAATFLVTVRGTGQHPLSAPADLVDALFAWWEKTSRDQR